VLEIDPLRALEMSAAAALMRTYGADSGATLGSADVLMKTSGDDTPRTVCLQQMLVAMTRAAESEWSDAVGALDVALPTGDLVDDADVLGNLGNTALQLGDDDAQQHFYSLALSRAREHGAVMVVVYILQRLCFGHLVAGGWAAVRSCAEEALALGVSMGPRALTAPPLAWLTLLAALQDRDDYESLLSELDEVMAAHPLGILTDPVHDLTRWAKGARAAGAADTFGALHHLARLRLPALARMAAGERIDAAVRAGQPELARRWVDELADFAEATGRPWALATVAYGRAMTADPAEADALFQDALSHHAHAGRPFDEARTHLAYGEWLRRAQRRVDARLHLRHALGTFQDLHADALARRATQELRASGETARKRDPSTLVKLTPMELKVAQLVSSGLSNKDVAAQCWVSPRTVAFHLRNVFAKAGITSRGELAQLQLG
jgi:DNA-binding CsgD family transcriptional regulator